MFSRRTAFWTLFRSHLHLGILLELLAHGVGIRIDLDRHQIVFVATVFELLL